MDRISAGLFKSKYIDQEHLTIFINGTSIDQFVDKNFPDHDFIGLIPSLLNWMDNKHEIELTWERICPKEGEISIAPLLICPDDLDFSCTTVVVEIFRTENNIKWLRFGLNLSNIDQHNGIDQVEWFQAIKPLIFKDIEYQKMIDSFLSHNKMEE